MIFNAVYQFIDDNSRIRIIYISVHENLCAYIRLETTLATPILEQTTVLEQEIESNNLVEVTDPYMQLIEESSLSEYVKNERDETWEIIQRYWEPKKLDLLNKSTRMQVFEEISKESNISVMTVRRMFSRFWEKGMTPNACILDYKNSGAPGKEKTFTVKTGRPRTDGSIGINIDEKVEKHFEIAINKYYRTKQCKSLTAVFHQLLEDFYSIPIKENGEIKRHLLNKSSLPTYDQFYYWFKKNENPGLDIIKRDGDKKYELTSRPILGDSKMEAPGPGFRYQIDATPLDIYAVNEEDRSQIIGRPIAYRIIDVYSRLITGLYVGLETNSWNGAMMALDSIVADKSALCAEYDITLSNENWPSSRLLPMVIIADRGEMKGHGVENLIKNFKVDIENTSPYRGDYKGIVERSFRTLNEKLKTFLPGAIMKDFRKRGDPDYRLDAKLTLDELRKVVLLATIEHNLSPIDGYRLTPDMVRDNIKPTPVEIWHWGIAKKKGCLHKVDPLKFRLGILPRGNARLERGAVIFHKLYYGASELLVDYNHMKISEKKVEVIYDPRNMRNIYMVKPDNTGYILLNLLEKSREYANLSLENILKTNKQASILKKSADEEHLKITIQINQAIQNIAKAATKATNEQRTRDVPKSQRIANIRSNRAEEKSALAEKESLIQSPPKIEGETTIIPFSSTKPDTTTAETSSENDLIERIRRRKNEHRTK